MKGFSFINEMPQMPDPSVEERDAMYEARQSATARCGGIRPCLFRARRRWRSRSQSRARQ
jgi:hypothetical protein